MTIASQTSRISYSGDGSTTAFAVPFWFQNNADLTVYLRDAGGNATLQLLGTNYTLSGAGVSAGGTCTFLTAPASGYNITIYRDPPITQTTSFNDNDPLPAKSIENLMDKGITIDQRTRDLASRSVHLSDADASASMVLPTLEVRKGRVAGYDPSTGLPSVANNSLDTLDSFLSGALATDAGFNRVVLTANLATLKALTPFAGAVVNMQGNVTANDGGEGVFNWNATSTATPDDEIVIQPNAGGVGRWVRQSSIIKILSDNYIDVKAHYGIVGDGASGYGDGVKMQYALDHAPLGCVLVCPPALVPLDVPLVMSRPMSIKMDQNFQLRGDFGAGALDILQIGITDTGLGGDVRNLVIEGGYLWSQYQTGDGIININPTPADYLPHFELLIRNVKAIGNFRAVRIGGANAAGDTNFCTIEGCNLGINSPGAAAVDLDNCADGHRIINNLVFGVGSGVRVNVVLGAFNTTIQGNGLVTRDGGVLIRNGSRVLIDGNQIEQQGGVNGLTASIVIQGNDYKAAGNIITRNNFGGGGNVDYNIRIENGHHTVIDLNQMNVTAVADVVYIDAGGGNHADYNTIGGRNTFRGVRGFRLTDTDANRRMIVSKNAACVGNRGIWESMTGATYSNGWAPDNLRYFIDENSIIHWEGDLAGGTLTAGTAITSVPAWARPNKNVLRPIATAGGLGIMTFITDGSVSLGSVNAPNADVGMSGISYPVNWMDTYDVGP